MRPGQSFYPLVLRASGTRLLGTLVHHLAISDTRWCVATLCIGVGQALAVVLEKAGGARR